MNDCLERGVRVWSDAVLGAVLFAIDPAGCGGIVLKAPAGPVRDRWLQLLRGLLPTDCPFLRLPISITADRLLGGLDLPATLNTGRPVRSRGLLANANGGVLLVPMAERINLNVSSQLTAALDTGEVAQEREGFSVRETTRFGVVALDESIEVDECPPASLVDRLAVMLDLSEVSLQASKCQDFESVSPECIIKARQRLGVIRVDQAYIDALCKTALALGIGSLRAPLLTLKLATAAAAWYGNPEITDRDAELACRLVLGRRATCLPSSEPYSSSQDSSLANAAEDNSSPAPNTDDRETSTSEVPPEDLQELLLNAAQSALPPGLLALLQADKSSANCATGGRNRALLGTGRRGPIVGMRSGLPGPQGRLSVVDTLRVAAPWQRFRRKQQATPEQTQRVQIRREDFRISIHRQSCAKVTLFAIDASGSTALQRLAEAKGAVELMLADCYIQRDQVALIAFRGRKADLLLPPTRSLVRAKRSLANLPGGGATPLATGIDSALSLAQTISRRGDATILVLLTDGHANVTKAGLANREIAKREALVAAKGIHTAHLTSLVVDTAPQPNAFTQQLAETMHARYVALPHVNAPTLINLVRSLSPKAVAAA